MRLRAEHIKRSRPKVLDKVVEYDSDYAYKPSSIRISFSDGSTAVYDRRIEQPPPQILRNIEIIRKWKGYTPPEVRDEKD